MESTLDPERWQRIKQVFDEALAHEGADRDVYLQSACAGDSEIRSEVMALLDAHASAGSRYDHAAVSDDLTAGQTFGAYRIIRRLGAGGMGSVYLAARADDQFRRLAAVKTIRAELLDETTRRRFENERHTLAALEHPNIVRLLDGGTENGLPYLVMDYVEGQPIDQYCRDRDLGISERLQLFRQLCGAVHYAHQNLIVHRDLKPANVLVTPQGVPKLLDFGIAKLLRPEYAAGAVGYTRTAARPMTLEYASPEQVRGQPVTTASDIYSLGVLLYKLLSGKHPFQEATASDYELERAICETQARRPSESAPPAAARLLKGDLDAMALMAMRKEPQRRYASAEHLSEDVRRYLAGEPVAARGDSLLYRARKFAGRHRIAVAATVFAAVILAALGGDAYRQDRRNRRLVQGLRGFANFTISDLDRVRKAPTEAQNDIVRRAVDNLNALARDSAGDDSLRHDLVIGYLKMADLQGNLFKANTGNLAAAIASANQGFAVANDLIARKSPEAPSRAEMSQAHQSFGELMTSAGQHATAIEHYRKAMEFSDRGDWQRAYSLLTDIGIEQEALMDPAAAASSYNQILDLVRDNLKVPRKAIAWAKERYAWCRMLAGQHSDAEAAVREAIAIYQQNAGPKPSPNTRLNMANARKTLAEVLFREGRAREALDECRADLSEHRSLLAEDAANEQYSRWVARDQMLLADLLASLGSRVEARAAAVEAAAYFRPKAIASPPVSYYLLSYLQEVLNGPFNDLADSTETLELARKAVGLNGADCEALDYLAKAASRTGQFREAEESERKALELLPPTARGSPKSEFRQRFETTLAAIHAQAATH
jgi:non-specific serine/threonine protein kinase/serine/threonine-protein kinase